MKLGKEIKLELLNNYKTKIGTVNNKESKSLYINLTAWGQLKELDENLNYDYFLSNIRKKIKQKLNNSLNEELFHSNKYIVDLDMRTSGLSLEKRSFMSCEITLFQENEVSINSDSMKKDLNIISSLVIDETFEKDKDFKYHKKKQ